MVGGVPPAYNSARLYMNEQSARASARPQQPTGWNKPAVPENLPPPPAKYTKQYEQYKQEMVESYRQKGARPVTEVLHLAFMLDMSSLSILNMGPDVFNIFI